MRWKSTPEEASLTIYLARPQFFPCTLNTVHRSYSSLLYHNYGSINVAYCQQYLCSFIDSAIQYYFYCNLFLKHYDFSVGLIVDFIPQILRSRWYFTRSDIIIYRFRHSHANGQVVPLPAFSFRELAIVSYICVS